MKDPVAVDGAVHAIQTSGVQPGKVWLHTKTQSTYEVLCLSVDEVRVVALVTYKSRTLGYIWTRDLDVFLGQNEDGELRFTRVP